MARLAPPSPVPGTALGPVAPALCSALVTVVALGLGACSSDPAGAPPANPADAAPAVEVAPGDRLAPADAAPAAPPLPEISAFRLGPNLPLAHIQRGGGLFVDTGVPGFVKYLRFGLPALRWDLGHSQDGRAVARPARIASLELPLTEAQAGAEALYLGVHASRAQVVALKIDGRKAGEVELSPGWQVARMQLTPGRMAAGENFLAFEVRRGQPPALAWLQIGGAAPGKLAVTAGAGDDAAPAAAPADDAAATARAVAPVGFDPDTDTLTLDRASGLVYYVYVPPGARLRGQVAPADCVIDVRVQAGIGAVEGELRGDATYVGLDALAGQVARLELSAGGCDRAHLRGPHLSVPGADTPAPARPAPKHVIVWIMSGLRADRLRPFAPYARPEVPGFERLAAGGLGFAATWTQAPTTTAARAALWTGRYPLRADRGDDNERGPKPNARELRRRREQRAQRKAPALGVEMRAAGLTPIAVTASMAPTPGFADGFATWTQVPSPAPGQAAPGAEVVTQALAALDQGRGKGPTFLLLETADSRLPWVGHQPWLGRYDPGAYQGPFTDSVQPSETGPAAADRARCAPAGDERDQARLRAIYDAGVSYQDALLVQLLDQLAQWGVLDETLLVITADHGQELGEAERCGHGDSLRESLLGVPLFLHYPPLSADASARIDSAAGAELVDVLPTLVRALGRPTPEPVQGQSLLERAPPAHIRYPRPHLAALDGAGYAIRLGAWKLVVGGAGAAALYDLSEDPKESHDLAQDQPYARRYAADPLALYLFHRARWHKRTWGLPSNLTNAGWRQLAGRD
ncbi:sulfatase-like hydrolase/transferase [Haliangium sp.]|uniref:sulfatase-like hydrolase/transferase n=1 Tax=Haliangium sp. TaxID=2663208 RepID=UPI003D0DF038